MPFEFAEEEKLLMEEEEVSASEDDTVLSFQGNEDKEDAGGERLSKNFDMQVIRHQNDLLLFCFKQSEERETSLKRELEECEIAVENNTALKKMKLKEEEWLHEEKECKEKLERVEKALSVKTDQLVAHARRDC